MSSAEDHLEVQESDRSLTVGPSGRSDHAPGWLYGLLFALLTVSTLLKAWLVFHTNVVWEEAHFAVAARHLDWGYADIPAGFPLLTAAFQLLIGWSPEGLRLVGLLFGQALPLAIWFLAEPLVGRRNALWAACLAYLFIPMAVNGVVYYPETFMQLAMVMMLGFFVRAQNDNRWINWASVGVFAAIGLSIHYRFALVGLGVLLFLVLVRSGREQWRRPGLYLAGALAALGTVPWLIYNSREKFASFQFHLVDRLDWGFNPDGFTENLTEQLAYLSPVFAVILVVVGWRVAKTTTQRGGAMACLMVSLGIFGFFAAISPLYSTRFPHWPFMAYAPLLPFVPGLVADWLSRAQSSWSHGVRVATLGIGVVWSLVLAGGLSTLAYLWNAPERLPEAQRHILSRLKFEDWQVASREIAALAERAGLTSDVIAMQGHWNAVRLIFPGVAQQRVFAIATRPDVVAGFDRQQARWGSDETALARDYAGRPVLLVLEEPDYLYHDPHEVELRQRVCAQFDAITLLGRVLLEPGNTLLEVYSAVPRPEAATPQSCPLLPKLYIAQPQRAAKLPKGDNIFGIAAFEEGVDKVEVLINGAVVKEAETQIDAPGFRAPDILNYDPDYPRVQWAVPLDGRTFPEGRHRLSIRATLRTGAVVESEPRFVYAVR